MGSLEYNYPWKDTYECRLVTDVDMRSGLVIYLIMDDIDAFSASSYSDLNRRSPHMIASFLS